MFGAIDVGTNSVRLLIGRVGSNKVKTVYRDLCSTRLGEGLESTGQLSEEAVRRTAKALGYFKQKLVEYGVTGYKAVATSAARDACNNFMLLSEAKKYGVEVEIISGQAEAALSYSGAIGIHGGLINPVVADIGGGSTELIYQDKDGRVQSSSTNVGAVRCTEGLWSEQQIFDALQHALEDLRKQLPATLVGVGGTITTLAAMDQQLAPYDPDKVQGYTLETSAVERLLHNLESLSLAERQKVVGLRPERADIITAGTRILKIILRELELERLVVSESDLLDGIILDLNKSTLY